MKHYFKTSHFFFSILLLPLVTITYLAFAEPFVRVGQGIRNLGMGNVGTALSHDENALFYNPAGLARVEEVYGSLNMLLSISDDILRTGKNTKTTPEDAKDIKKIFQILLDQTFYGRAMASINLLIPMIHSMTFGATFFYDGETLVALENSVLPKFSVGFNLNEGQAFGVSLPVTKSNSFILGLGTRIMNRRVELPYTTFTLAKIIRAGQKVESLFPTGTQDPARGVGGDMGIQWRIPGNLRITVGAVAQNIGQMKFLRKSNRTTPKDRPMEISIGASMQPEWGPFRLLAATDVKDLTMQGTKDSDIEKRIHSGFELSFLPIDSTTSFASVRGGYNQGYATFGFEINPLIVSKILTIQYARYAEELGKKSGDQKNPRSVVQISLKLGKVLL